MSKYMIGFDWTLSPLGWLLLGSTAHSEPINAGMEATMAKTIPRRTCPDCKRVTRIRQDGRFYTHRTHPGAFFTWCAGSDRPAPRWEFKQGAQEPPTLLAGEIRFDATADPGSRFALA